MVWIPDTFSTQLVQFLHGLKKVGNVNVLMKNTFWVKWSELQTRIQIVTGYLQYSDCNCILSSNKKSACLLLPGKYQGNDKWRFLSWKVGTITSGNGFKEGWTLWDLAMVVWRPIGSYLKGRDLKSKKWTKKN